MFAELTVEQDIWAATRESDAILVANKSGIITWITAVAEKLFGYNTRNELVGHNVNVLVPEAIQSLHIGYVNGFWQDPKARPMGENRVLDGRHRDGHTFKVSVTLVPWMIGGEPQCKATICDMAQGKAK